MVDGMGKHKTNAEYREAYAARRVAASEDVPLPSSLVDAVHAGSRATPVKLPRQNFGFSLADLARQRDQVEGTIRAIVTYEREHGASWGEIGDALGVSKQAAQQRYGRTERRSRGS